MWKPCIACSLHLFVAVLLPFFLLVLTDSSVASLFLSAINRELILHFLVNNVVVVFY